MSSFIEQIRYVENRNLRILNRLVCFECRIGVFGAGGYAYTLIEEMKRLSISIDYCVVDDMYYQPESTCNGVRVYSLLECNQAFKNSILVVGFGLNYKNENAVMNRIRNQVDTSIEIIDFEDQFLSYFYYLDYSMILKNEESFQRLYDRLHDDESKGLLVDYINGRISGDLHSMGRYAPSSSFDYLLDILLNRCTQNKSGSVVDCGAFDGKSAIEMSEYLHDDRRIYALECDPDNFMILEEVSALSKI